MHFVQVVESVITDETTSKVKGLTASDVITMEQSLQNAKKNYSRRDHVCKEAEGTLRDSDCIEAEVDGVTILNILGGIEYKLYGQSMAMEETVIGGRTILVQKTIWTMGK